MEIAGKVFIVTGGASGLGEGTARMLAANGGKVEYVGTIGFRALGSGFAGF